MCVSVDRVSWGGVLCLGGWVGGVCVVGVGGWSGVCMWVWCLFGVGVGHMYGQVMFVCVWV